MAQNTVNFGTDPSGVELLDDLLEPFQENELTSNSGTSRPSYAQSGTVWVDTTSTPWVWKMFNGTSDIVLGNVDPSSLTFTPSAISVPDDSITDGKLAEMAANTVKVNATNTTANPTNITLTSSTVLGRGPSGNITAVPYSTFATAAQGALANTAVQPDDVPTYIPAGTPILLATATASNSPTVDFNGVITSTYDEYVLKFYDVVPQTDITELRVRTSSDNGVNFDSATNNYRYSTRIERETTTNLTGGGDTSLKLCENAGNAATESLSGSITFYTPSNTNYAKHFEWKVQQKSNNATSYYNYGGGIRDNSALVNAIRLFMSSGNISSGTFKLYGIKK